MSFDLIVLEQCSFQKEFYFVSYVPLVLSVTNFQLFVLISKVYFDLVMVLNGLVKFEFYLYIHMAGHELIWDALIKLRRDQRLKCSLAKIRIRINNLAWHLGMAGQLSYNDFGKFF